MGLFFDREVDIADACAELELRKSVSDEQERMKLRLKFIQAFREGLREVKRSKAPIDFIEMYNNIKRSSLLQAPEVIGKYTGIIIGLFKFRPEFFARMNLNLLAECINCLRSSPEIYEMVRKKEKDSRKEIIKTLKLFTNALVPYIRFFRQIS